MCVDDYHFILFLASAPEMRIGDTEYRAKKGDMLVVRPWEEVYGVPCKNKEYGRYLHIAVKKEFFTEVAAEAAEEGKFMDQDEAEAYFAKLNDLGYPIRVPAGTMS